MVKNKQKSSLAIIITVIVLVAIAVLAYYYFSVDKISEVKVDENVGDKVTVKGEVKTVIKIGSLSGYTLEDNSGSIAVSSKELPKEGDKMRVKGTLIKDTLLGYYIKAN